MHMKTPWSNAKTKPVHPHEIHVTAGAARATTTGVEGALDVPFTLSLGGRELTGGATLLPREDGGPGYRAWGGGPDHWLDGRTVAALRELHTADYRLALEQIEEACAEACSARDAA